ncbi:MAG: DUF5063 domain-containing protein [Muribaculaceae bacterium]|jgi:hypothetical protein|nr:DUF5063 domain-containing protein [Muribaculaceae bacterium]
MEKLTPNELTFIALANEYCHAMEHALEHDSREQFVGKMLKLLPRLYITMMDLEQDPYTDAYIEPALEEDVYDMVRERVAQLMAEEDIYLEVFVEDMKYSDTPISASVSENLADLYQEFFNLIHSAQEAMTETQHDMLCQCRLNAENYWSQTLCNVLRALNAIYHGI